MSPSARCPRGRPSSRWRVEARHAVEFAFGHEPPRGMHEAFDHRRERDVEQQRLAAAVFEHVVDFRRLQLVVDRHERRAEPPRAEHQVDERRCVEAHRGDTVAGRDAERAQHGCRAVRVLARGIGDRRGFADEEWLVGRRTGSAVEAATRFIVTPGGRTKANWALPSYPKGIRPGTRAAAARRRRSRADRSRPRCGPVGRGEPRRNECVGHGRWRIAAQQARLRDHREPLREHAARCLERVGRRREHRAQRIERRCGCAVRPHRGRRVRRTARRRVGFARYRAQHVEAHHVAEPSQIELTGASRNSRAIGPSST